MTVKNESGKSFEVLETTEHYYKGKGFKFNRRNGKCLFESGKLEDKSIDGFEERDAAREDERLAKEEAKTALDNLVETMKKKL